ncbi:MAG: DUF1552 domain-containing protein [Myxococcaceae bacterium]|nr:DUF1552 domain-containing protein [Myxococcaceae bacterium]
MSLRISRRNVLRGAAGFTLALPWLESFAQAATPPRRIVFCFTANGDQISRRMIKKSETGFVFDDMLSPFEPWRDELLVLDGLNKFHNKLPEGQQADAHEQGGSALAPWPSGSGSFPIGGTDETIGYVMGPSADHAIGERVQAENPSVPYRHLVYRVGDNFNNIWNQHSHAGPVGTQAPIPPETSPFKAYQRIFGNLNTGQQDLLKKKLLMRQTSLDLMKDELSALKSRVSAADRLRLEQHEESLREVERGLTSLQNTLPACAPLDLGSSFNVYDSSRYKEVGFLFFKMIAMAFACDLTRSVQFNWSGNTSDRVYSDIGMTEGHHTISHNSDEDSFAKIRAIKKNLFQLSTQLHTELKAIPEAGGTVWDNTLVVHWSELSQGDTHARNDDLVIFASGSKNYFRLGRYLNLKNAAKHSFSDMLVSCFHYMGFTDVTTFGYEALASGGPLDGLT